MRHTHLRPRRMDHSIRTLTAAKVAAVLRKHLEAIAADNPRFHQALRRDMLLTAAIQRIWKPRPAQRLRTCCPSVLRAVRRLKAVGSA